MEASVHLCFIIVMIGSCFSAFGQQHQRPNIVFILADDLVSNNLYTCLIKVK